LWFPEKEFSFSLLTRAMKPYMGPDARVLDLGAGTGNLSRTILETYPEAKVTLVDFSSNMLEEVSHVLSKHKGTYTIREGDLFRIDYPEEEYNCVISSFALHHGRGADVYGQLYKKIYKSLKQPGLFICCDVIEGSHKPFSELNEGGWREFLKKNFSEKEIARIFSNYRQEDSPLAMKEHLDLLADAGFINSDVLWKKFNFGIYAGVKQ
ncbi:MAG: methyltransferase domain-containing protein, partial [Spirochaetes bacterium]|nr:methyltransferase domain-containing protein [Spirochaetota bacterium]